MNYVIKNHKNLYIRLNEDGKAISCSSNNKGIFEKEKAKKILTNLPRTLKRFHFQIEEESESVQSDQTDVKKDKKKNVIKNNEYELSQNILLWQEKFGYCADILEEARKRADELLKNLEQIDWELVDILHSIEMEPAKDLYNSWKIYRRIRENRKHRREMKDEFRIIKNVLNEVDPYYLKRENVQKSIEGLFTRKYTFRIIEEEKNDL